MSQRSQVTAGLHWNKRHMHRCILHFSAPIHLHLLQRWKGALKFKPNEVDNDNQAQLTEWINESKWEQQSEEVLMLNGGG